MKPNNDMLKSIEAIIQLLSPTSDKRKVDIIAIKAKVIRNFFLDSFLYKDLHAAFFSSNFL